MLLEGFSCMHNYKRTQVPLACWPPPTKEQSTPIRDDPYMDSMDERRQRMEEQSIYLHLHKELQKEQMLVHNLWQWLKTWNAQKGNSANDHAQLIFLPEMSA
jgi:hypothetical protein